MLRKKEFYESMVGRKQGSITIIGIEKIVPKKGRLWLCRCDCGEEFLESTSNLNQGRKHCAKCAGMENKKRTRQQLGKHLQSGTKLWHVWKSMISRCTYPGDTNFQYYGGRGITVCEEWRNSFETFQDWAFANGYRDGLSIERKEVNGDYCPDNCEWIPLENQKYNKRSARLITVRGETHLLTEWARIIGVNHSAIIYAEKHGKSAEEYIDDHLQKNKEEN